MAAYLVDVDSSDRYFVTEPICNVGADPTSDVVIAAPSVLPAHVLIQKQEEEYWVSLAEGARNSEPFLLVLSVPTASLNGEKLQHEPMQLVDGDKLKVGSRLLQMRIV